MKESSIESTFLIKSQAEKVLTKDQIKFNSLSKKIEELRIRIIQAENNCDNRLNVYHEFITPIEQKLAEAKINFIKYLYSYYNQVKLTHKQQNNVIVCITITMEEVAEFINLDDELKEIYNTFIEISFDEELSFQGSEIRDELTARLLRDFGIEIDFSDIDFNEMTPENEERIKSKILEALEEKNDLEQDPNYNSFFKKEKTKKKTKAQIKNEELEKQKEEIKNKSIRSIYLSLVKILHPDKEIDTVKKLEKEDLMKKVVSAYESNDITTLLKLEMQWLISEESNSLDDDKIKIYIEVLKEQTQELQTKLSTISFKERFLPIFEYLGYTDKKFQKTLNEKHQVLKEEIELYTNPVNEFQDFKKNKKTIQSLVEEINYFKSILNEMNNFWD